MPKFTTRMLAAAFGALLLVRCAAPAPEPAPVSHDLTQADVEAVRAAWNALLEAQSRTDWDAIVDGMMADDFVHFDPRTGPLRGIDEWRRWVDSMEFESGDGSDYVIEEVAGSGDLAYVLWTFSGSWMEGETPVTTQGKGLSIYTRTADGSWKLARNAWNTTPAETAEE